MAGNEGNDLKGGRLATALCHERAPNSRRVSRVAA
jgi:hypothetical protein